MADFRISDDLAERLEMAAKQKHISVERLISEWLDNLAASQATLHREDRGWLELSSQTFSFWENAEDAAYDHQMVK